MTREEFDLLPGEEKFSRLMFLTERYLKWFSDIEKVEEKDIPMSDLTHFWDEFEDAYNTYKENSQWVNN